MKTDKTLMHKLLHMECKDLITMIEEDYYRTMIACKVEEVNTKLLDLIDDALNIELHAVHIDVERYDIGVILRDYRVSLADRIILDI